MNPASEGLDVVNGVVRSRYGVGMPEDTSSEPAANPQATAPGATPTPPAPATPPPVAPVVPAGWYPDATTGQRRWWDGTAWTDQYQPAPSAGRGTAALVLGIIAIALAAIPGVSWVAFALAIIAVILGLVGLRKPAARGRSLIGLILGGIAFILSLVLGIVYAVILFAVVTPTSDSGAGPQNAPIASHVPATTAPKVNPYDSLYGKFTPITQSGRSDTVITLPTGFKAGIVTATYSGSANFIVNGLDSSNQITGDGPINVIGAYKGTTLIGFDDIGSKDASLQVEASGPWSITISPISAAQSAVPVSGSGDTVFLYDGPAADWTLTSNGQGNFIVNEYSGELFPGIGVNEIGAYTGKDPVDPGPAVVELISDGRWTITQ